MKKLLINLIKIYQITISPEKGVFVKKRPVCRFQPTCSEYFIQALKKHSFLRAVFLGVRRVCRCHPFGSHGYDPVPQSTLKNN